MTDKILLVTPPDDTLLQGIRILHVDLNEQQSTIVSNALMSCELSSDIINYVWKMGNAVTWLLDKATKCDLIIFNADGPAESGRDVIMGWTAAQSNSYYFGNLKDLHHVNNRAIYTSDDLLKLMEKLNKNHD